MIFFPFCRQLLRRIWLAGCRQPLTRHPRYYVGYILIAHRMTRRSATPVRVSKVGTSGNDDGAQCLVIHESNLGDS